MSPMSAHHVNFVHNLDNALSRSSWNIITNIIRHASGPRDNQHHPLAQRQLTPQDAAEVQPLADHYMRSSTRTPTT